MYRLEGSIMAGREKEMPEVSVKSRAASLQKLMDQETENIRLWKVDMERKVRLQHESLQSKDGAISRLQKELHSCQLEKDEALGIVKANDAKLEKLSNNVDSLAAKHQRLLAAFAERESQERVLREQHDLVLEEKQSYKGEFQRLTNKFRDYQQKVAESLEEASKKVEGIKSEYYSKLTQMEEVMESDRHKFREVVAELSATKESHLLSVEKVSFLQDELGKKESQIVAAYGEKETMREAHCKEKDGLNAEINKLEKDVFALERDFADERRKSECLGGEMASLAEKARCLEIEKERIDGELSESGRELMEKENVLNEKEKLLCEANGERDSLKSRLNTVEISLVEVNAAKLKLEDDDRRISSELDEARNELRIAREDLEATRKGNEQMKVESDEKQKEIMELESALLEAKERLASLEEEAKYLESKLVNYEEKLNESKKVEGQCQTEIKFLGETIRQKEAEYTNMSSRLQEILSERDSLEEKTEELQNSLNAEEEKYSSKEAELTNVQKELAKVELDLKKAKGEQQVAVDQLEMMKSALDKAFREKGVCDSDKVQLEMGIKSLQNQLRECESKLAASMEEKQKADEGFGEKEAEWKRREERLLQELEEERSALKSLEDSSSALNSNTQELNRERKRLMNDVDRLQKRLEKKGDELKESDVEVESLKAKLKDSEAGQAKALAEVKQQEKKFSEHESYSKHVLKETKSAYDVGFAKMVKERKEVETKLAKTEEMLEELRKEKTSLEEKSSAVLKENEKLSSEIADLKLNYDLKDSECKGLSDRLAKLEEEKGASTSSDGSDRVETATEVESVASTLQAPSVLEISVPTAREANSPVLSEPRVPDRDGVNTPSFSAPNARSLDDISPAIRRRSTQKRSLSSHTPLSKKGRVTFGQGSSRIISPVASPASSSPGEDVASFLARTKSPAFRSPRTLSVKPRPSNAVSPMVSQGAPPAPRLPKKFLELKEKNTARKKEKERKKQMATDKRKAEAHEDDADLDWF